MKHIRLSIFFLFISLLFSYASAVSVTESVNGVLYWPDPETSDTPQYTYSYSYPYAEGDDDTAGTINETFQYLIDDAIAFTVPMNGEALMTDLSAKTDVIGKVTFLNDDWLSILIVQHDTMDGEEHETYRGYTFPLFGIRKGSVTSLPRVLGILKDDESDTWMQDRQTAKANDLVWHLVWDEIQQQLENGSIDFFEDLDFEAFTWDFYPEEDFYLNQNGEIVFFIQAGFLADDSYGILSYPFDIEDLKDEL